MKSLLVPLFIAGAVSVDVQSAVGYSPVSQSNFNSNSNQRDGLCPKNPQQDSCLLPHNLLGSINLYPSLLRQATHILLARWQSSGQQPGALLSTKSVQTDRPNYQTLLPNTNPLPDQFPMVARSSLLLSSPNLKKLDTRPFIHPAPKTKAITSHYGWRRRPYSGKLQFHKGIDYGAPLGSPVVATKEGVVIRVVSGCADFGNKFCGSQFGNWIEIDHGNGIIASYAHLRNRSILVKKGMKVNKNQKIAQVGSSGWSTGAHLDFRLKVKGQYQNPTKFLSVKIN